MALAAEGVRGAVHGAGHRRRARCDSPAPIDATVRRITDAGGEAITVPTNLARDDDVDTMVARTVDTFGGVDVLVNNTAITFAGDLKLDMKRFDLVFAVDLARRCSPSGRWSRRMRHTAVAAS